MLSSLISKFSFYTLPKIVIFSVINMLSKNLFIFTDKEASYKSEEEVNRPIKQRQKR